MKKNIILFIFCLAIVSCSKSEEEKKFTDFKTIELNKILKTTPEELNFKIQSIAKVKEIKASDSIEYLHKKLLETYEATGEKEKLTYDYAIKQVDTLISSLQDLIELRIKARRSYENYKDINSRDEWIIKKANLEKWKSKTDNYSKNKDEILSIEYNIKYSIDNPLLKITQNFNSQIYTNKENTKIIREIKND